MSEKFEELIKSFQYAVSAFVPGLSTEVAYVTGLEESKKFDYPFQVIAVLVRRLGGEAVILPDEIFENYTVQTFLDVNGVFHITAVPGGSDERKV